MVSTQGIQTLLLRETGDAAIKWRLNKRNRDGRFVRRLVRSL